MKPEVEQELAHILLTELLAYQFASPVRWIETQDVFLKDFNTERVVEIGPSPTLAGMAQRTLKNKYESYDAALSYIEKSYAIRRMPKRFIIPQIHPN